MKAASTEKKKDSQNWPYVTWSETKELWIVDARTKQGGHRKYFHKKGHAETYASDCRSKRDGHGTALFGNADLAEFGKTVQDAIAYYLDYLRKTAKSVTIGAAVRELLELRKSAGASTRYCRDLKLRLGRFESAHGGSTLAEIKAKNFAAWLAGKEPLKIDAGNDTGRTVASFTAKELDAWLSALKVAPGTRNTFQRDLRTLFSFCEKRGYCATNEARKTERAKALDKPAGILTVKQCEDLLTACGDDVLPVAAVALFAGLRAAEIEKLDWSEIDLESGMIEVTAAKSKTARRRLVPISDNLTAWIRPLARQDGPVAPAGLRKRFDAVKTAAGLKKWPQNALRHSYGSYRLAQCQDAPRVSLEMGNSPQMVFAHYRELVKPKEACRFWNLRPAAA